MSSRAISPTAANAHDASWELWAPVLFGVAVLYVPSMADALRAVGAYAPGLLVPAQTG
ncbi:MAG: hypothetical protein WAX67_03660 [Rugosibacter sp.]